MRRLAAALLVLALGVAFVAARGAGYLGGLRTAPAVLVAGPPVTVILDTLRARETVSQLFLRRGVSGVDWGAVARSVRNFDSRRLRAGLVFQFRQRHGETAPHAVVVRVSHDSRLRLTREGAVWTPSVEEISWHSEPMTADGVVRVNLYQAMDDALSDEVLPAGARSELVWGLAEVYDWSVDFTRDIQSGDRFRVLAERLVSSEGEVRYGRVLAARLDLSGRAQYAFRYDGFERTEFFDETGHSMRREFLRAPLEFRRVSSRFAGSRRHPILGIRRAHAGTDFVAPIGTPVRAVADGSVGFAGRAGGYGNMVEIRHSVGRNVTTRYGHLSAFARGVEPGARVRQGETVGYVGASGLATGPHLHYEMRVGGRAVNPRRLLGVGAGRLIPTAHRDAFERERRRLLDLLEPRPAALTPRAD